MADRKTTLTIDLKPTGGSAVKDAFADVARSIEGQQTRLDRLKAAMSPENLRARAVVELETDAAEKKLKELLAVEKKKIPIDVLPADAAKQKGLLGHAADWLKKLGLPGGDMLGKIGEHLGTRGAAGGIGGGQLPPAPALTPSPAPSAASAPGSGIGGVLKGLLGGGGGAAEGSAAAAGGAMGGAGAGMLAAAGPIGLAVGAVAVLAPVVKKLASAPFAAITAGMGAVNKALGGLSSSLGPITSVMGGLQGVGSSMKGVGDKLGPLGIGLSVMGSAIEGITSQVTAFLNTAVSLAGKAMPGVTRRFQLAVDDTAAVVGHRLVPVVELMTKVVRGIGDVLQTVLPSAAEFRSALAPLGEAFDDVKEAVTPFLPLIKSSIVSGLRLIGAQIKMFAGGLKLLLGPLKDLNDLLNRMGMGVKLNSSVGAAARPVSFMDSQSYARSVYTAAGSSGVSPAQQTAKNTSTMATLLQQIRDKLPGQSQDPSWKRSASRTADFLTGGTGGPVLRYLWGH